jgi:hypothetical protein
MSKINFNQKYINPVLNGGLEANKSMEEFGKISGLEVKSLNIEIAQTKVEKTAYKSMSTAQKVFVVIAFVAGTIAFGGHVGGGILAATLTGMAITAYNNQNWDPTANDSSSVDKTQQNHQHQRASGANTGATSLASGVAGMIFGW